MAHRRQNQQDGHGQAEGDGRQHARAAPHPIPTRRHGRAEQQGQRRVARHRVILLRSGERKKKQQEAGPAQRQQPCLPGAVRRLERQPRDRRKVDAPGKQPEQMKEPEVHSRDRVVVAWRAQVQKAQHLLIHEVKPEKAMVFAGNAAHCQVEIRRVAQSRQHVPRRGDQHYDGQAAPGPQPSPHLGRKQLPRGQEIDHRRPGRENHRDRALQQQPNSETGCQNERPPARMRFALVQNAEKGPHGECNRGGQHHVGDLNPRKQEETRAGGDHEAGVKARTPAKCPYAEGRGQPGEGHRG